MRTGANRSATLPGAVSPTGTLTEVAETSPSPASRMSWAYGATPSTSVSSGPSSGLIEATVGRRSCEDGCGRREDRVDRLGYPDRLGPERVAEREQLVDVGQRLGQRVGRRTELVDGRRQVIEERVGERRGAQELVLERAQEVDRLAELRRAGGDGARDRGA